jgi:hypothetical protein
MMFTGLALLLVRWQEQLEPDEFVELVELVMRWLELEITGERSRRWTT